MSNASAPRPRYIAVRLHAPAPVTRGQLARAIEARFRQAGVPPPQLTRFGHPHAILRCSHDVYPETRETLDGMADAVGGVRLETLLSSGTILTLTTRLGLLRERAPRGNGGRGANGRGAGAGDRASGPDAPRGASHAGKR